MATQNNALPTISTGDTDSPTATQGTGVTASTGSATGTGNTASTGSTGSTGTATATGTTAAGSASSSTSVAGITGAPQLSSETATITGGGGLTITGNAPKLSGYFSYPPASVPPTAGAPYLTSSSLPQNFVFIVVGSILAFFALCIVVWRFVAAWSVNRSFKRDAAAAAYTPLPDMKKPIHKIESAHDMSDLSAKLPKSFGSVPNLFFSPTAEVARQSYHGRPPSQHMPSGHYRDASR